MLIWQLYAKINIQIQNQVSMAAFILILIYVRVKCLQWIQLSAYVLSDDKLSIYLIKIFHQRSKHFSA